MAGLVVLLATPMATVLNGWALSILWRWFVVPTFNAPPLSVPIAIGVALVVGYLTHQHSVGEPDTDASRAAEIIFYWMFKPFWALGVGWIVLQFMGA